MSAEFEHSFLSLPENQFATAGIERLLTADPDVVPPLLLLHGPSGVGKSHLIHDQVARFLNRYQDVRYRILPAYEFATLQIESAASGSTIRELEGIEQVDLFVCEELHHVERQTWLQRKLIVLMDDILANGGRVILSSHYPIGEFQHAHPKLVSRCRSGITAALEQPSQQSRISLIHHYANGRGLNLPNGAAEKLAAELPYSPRELSGMMMHLNSISEVQEGDLTLDLIDNFLELQHDDPELSLSEIAKMVAQEFGVTVKAIRSETRERNLLIPRQTAMWLSRILTKSNFAEIGKYYGNRSHSTVMHACQALERKAAESPELDSRVNQLRRQLERIPAKPR